MAQCDELLITPASTFGGMAAILGGKLPFYVPHTDPYPIVEEQILKDLPSLTFSQDITFFTGLQNSLSYRTAPLEEGPGGKVEDSVIW